MKKTNTALILGVTGGFGRHLAQEFLNKGWKLNVLIRIGKKLPEQLQSYADQGLIKITVGDAFDSQAVRTAAQSCTHMVYGLNLPYGQWKTQALDLLEVSVQIAEQSGMTLVFPGNVYNFDPKDSARVDENAVMNAPTRKGLIRVAMEDRLKKASGNGARILILRAGDFIGEGAPSAWMQYLLKSNRNGFKLSIAATDRNLVHNWCYLPDLARYAVELIDQPTMEQPFQIFHVPGLQFSFNELASEISELTGLHVQKSAMPWWLYRMISPFSSFIREILEMQYLWDMELNLDGTKLNAALPGFRASTLSEALIGSMLISLPLKQQTV